MTYPRPSAWILIAVLVMSMLGSAGTAVTFAANPPPQCTGWTDEFHPPTEIRVRLSRGPSAGTVAVVPFWDYVGTVEAAEYSTSGPRGPIWLRMGALAVKEYGWYYAMHWRGGTVTITNEDGTTTTQCYDVRDTTADQIYKPVRLVNGEWIPANTPSAAQLQAMAETWPISLRKWVTTKQRSRFFLTGYRSGKKNPCGTDTDGFKIWQKSLGDCVVKGLNFEETQRRYYEPNVLIVDPRMHDVLDDNDANDLPTYYGDLGMLTPGANSKIAYSVYAGTEGGFADPVTGTLSIDPSNIAGQGVGDVNGDSRKDLVILLNTGNIAVAIANGAGYNDATTQNLPNDAPTDQLLVGDFDGDLLVDVGLLRSTPVAPLPGEPATLVVMRGTSSGTFNAPVDWWRGALDLTPVTGQQVAVGDVNGDGKADLVIRDQTVGTTFSVAPSFASCADLAGFAFTYWGPCTNVPGTGLDVATQWFNNPNWLTPTPEWTLTDFNADGRTDVVVVIKNGNGIDVFGAQAGVNALSFGNEQKMAHLDNVSFPDEVTPLGLDINPDGLGDLLLVKKSNGNTAFQWLRASQTAGSAAVTFVPANAYVDASIPWAPATTRAY